MDNAFIIIPKELFANEKYKKLSADAKLLYGIVRDRNSLSKKNNWLDENGNVFIVLSLDFVCEMIGCKTSKARKTVNELIECGLLKKKRIGNNKPNIYHVFDLYAEKEQSGCLKYDNPIYEKEQSGCVKNNDPDALKTTTNKTEYNKTDFSNTFFIFEEEEEIRDGFKTMIDYDWLCETEDKGVIDEIVGIVTDTFKSLSKTVKIGQKEYDRQFAFERFMSLDSSHILYVLDILDDNDKPIKNMRQYLLTLLFNSKNTIETYYTNKFNNDCRVKRLKIL